MLPLPLRTAASQLAVVKTVLALSATFLEPNFVLPSLPWQLLQLVLKAADRLVVLGVVGDAGAGEEPLDELQPAAVSSPTKVLQKTNERISMARIEFTPLRWFTCAGDTAGPVAAKT